MSCDRKTTKKKQKTGSPLSFVFFSRVFATQASTHTSVSKSPCSRKILRNRVGKIRPRVLSNPLSACPRAIGFARSVCLFGALPPEVLIFAPLGNLPGSSIFSHGRVVTMLPCPPLSMSCLITCIYWSALRRRPICLRLNVGNCKLAWQCRLNTVRLPPDCCLVVLWVPMERFWAIRHVLCGFLERGRSPTSIVNARAAYKCPEWRLN